jgi:hypothetical protein
MQASVVYYRELRDTWRSSCRVLGFARFVAHKRTRQAPVLAFPPRHSLPSCLRRLPSIIHIFPGRSNLFRARCGFGQNHSTTCVSLLQL